MSSRPVSKATPDDNFDFEDDFARDVGPEQYKPGETSASQQHKHVLKGRRLMLDMLARWHWIALGLILGGLGAAYYLTKAPKEYSASASLLIKQQTQTVLNKDQVDEIGMASIEGLNTVAERIRRHDLLERVASRMDVRALPGLIPPATDWMPEWLSKKINRSKAKGDSDDAKSGPPAPPVLANYLSGWMRVSIRRGTRLIDINFRHQVPEVAKALADAVAREYLAEIASDATEGRSSKTDVLTKQSEEARAKLQSAETALANYTRALEVHRNLETQEKSVSQLARRYKAKHPKMIAANAELDEIKKLFLQEFVVATNSAADAEYWKTSGAEIDASEGDPEAHLRVARQLLLARTGVLKGETQSQMAVFNAMLTRLEESNVNRQAESSSAEINSFALVPGGPVAPVASQIFTVGCGGGFALGLLVAGIRAQRRRG